jgi:hypothetical protein
MGLEVNTSMADIQYLRVELQNSGVFSRSDIDLF